MARSSKKSQGHPAKRDPLVAKLYKTQVAMVELVRDLQDHPDVPAEHWLWLRAGALSAMLTYSDLTGLPSPMDYIEMDVAHREREKQIQSEKSLCPICKGGTAVGKEQCFACGVDYSRR